ncbi:hypothetical protein LCGC14_1793990, partial [marine sediment metagenome]
VTPVVSGGKVTAIWIDFDELLDATTAEDLNNYALLASGGDAIFGNPNDVDLVAAGRVTDVTYNGVQRVTLTLTPGLDDDAYQLTVVGTASVEDPAGNPLNDGADEVQVIVANNNVATVAIALHPADDTGVPGDGITSDTNLRLQVTVNEAGVIELDYNNDAAVDFTFVMASAGTHTFDALPVFAEGTYTAAVDFTDTAAGLVEDQMALEVDLSGPIVVDIDGGDTAEIIVTFSEPLDPATATDPGNYVLIYAGPNGEIGTGGDDVVVPVVPAYVPGALTVSLATAGGFTEGLYSLTVNGTTSIADRAGNSLGGGADHVEPFYVDEADPYVAATEPVQDEAVVGIPPYVEVVFSEPIDPATIATTDLVLTGAAVTTTILSVVQVTPTTYRFNICPTSCSTTWITGTVNASLLAGAVTDISGRPLVAHAWSFAYTPLTGPQATLDVHSDAVKPEGTTALTILFDEQVQSVVPADVSLTETTLGTIVPDSVVFAGDGLSVTLTFAGGLAAATNDTYTLTVYDTVQNLAGAALDGDANGVAGGDYIKVFSVLMVGDVTGNGLVNVTDLGALASNWQAIGVGWRDGDFTGDGKVNITDLGGLASNWARDITGGIRGADAETTGADAVAPAVPPPGDQALAGPADGAYDGPAADAQAAPAPPIEVDLLAGADQAGASADVEGPRSTALTAAPPRDAALEDPASLEQDPDILALALPALSVLPAAIR